MAKNKKEVIIDTSKAVKSVESLENATRDLTTAQNDLTKSTGDLTTKEQAFVTQQEKMNTALVNGEQAFIDVNNGVGGMLTSIPKFIKANGGMIGSVKALSKALLANPIGLIAGLIAGLVVVLKEAFTAFTSTSEGSSKMGEVMGRLQPILNIFKGALVKVGEGMVWVLDKASAGIQRALEIAGKFSPQAKQMAEDMKVQAEASRIAAEANREYEKSLKGVESAEAAWNKELTNIELLKVSAGEKKKLLTDVYNTQKGLIDKEVAEYKAAYDAEKKLYEAKGENASTEDLARYTEAEDRYNALLEKQTTMYRDYATTINGFDDEIARIREENYKAEEAALETSLKNREEIRKKYRVDSVSTLKQPGSGTTAVKKPTSIPVPVPEGGGEEVSVLDTIYAEADALRELGDAGNYAADILQGTTQIVGALGDESGSASERTAAIAQGFAQSMNALGGMMNDYYESQIHQGEELTEQQKKENEKLFEQQKKVQIAMAAINMLSGIATAVATGMSLGPIAGPIVGAINASVVAASGALQIAKIKKTKLNANNTPTADSGASSRAASIPNMDINQEFTEGVETGRGNEETKLDTRVYVLESDITNTQNKVSTIESESTF